MKISDQVGTGLLLASVVVSVALCVVLWGITAGQGAWYADLWPPVFFAVMSVWIFFSCRKHFRKPAEARKMPDVSPLLVSALWLLAPLNLVLSEWRHGSPALIGLMRIAPGLVLTGVLVLIGILMLAGVLELMKSGRRGGGHV